MEPGMHRPRTTAWAKAWRALHPYLYVTLDFVMPWKELADLSGGYLATLDGNIPESLPEWEVESSQTLRRISRVVKSAESGCRRGLHHHPYNWTALHVAVRRGSRRAVKELLDRGASIKEKCRGLCDCLAAGPNYGRAPDPRGWQRPRQLRPTSWGILHIAICSGHSDIVRMLLSHGANYLPSCELMGEESILPAYVSETETGTAFHTAALTGDVPMCRLLLDHHLAQHPAEANHQTTAEVLAREDDWGLRALDYAVLAGHMSTTVDWLLGHGADPLQDLDMDERDFLTPLNFLCYWGRYRDASVLLSRVSCKPASLTLALQLCFARPGKIPAPLPSYPRPLRHFLDEYIRVGVYGEREWPASDSEEALLPLVTTLLASGADPAAVLEDMVPDPDLGSLKYARGVSALEMAARHGLKDTVDIILNAGAHGYPSEGVAMTAALKWALKVPRRSSQARTNPQMCLGTIVALLERGASFRDARGTQYNRGPRKWFASLVGHKAGGLTWNTLSDFDLFARVVELVAAQEGKTTIPVEWAVDFLYLASKTASQGPGFLRWYGLITDYPALDEMVFG